MILLCEGTPDKSIMYNCEKRHGQCGKSIGVMWLKALCNCVVREEFTIFLQMSCKRYTPSICNIKIQINAYNAMRAISGTSFRRIAPHQSEYIIILLLKSWSGITMQCTLPYNNHYVLPTNYLGTNAL